MPELSGRDLHLVKKALAIATLAIDRQFQSVSDQIDMKDLLDHLIGSDTVLERCLRAVRIAVTGEPDDCRLAQANRNALVQPCSESLMFELLAERRGVT